MQFFFSPLFSFLMHQEKQSWLWNSNASINFWGASSKLAKTKQIDKKTPAFLILVWASVIWDGPGFPDPTQSRLWMMCCDLLYKGNDHHILNMHFLCHSFCMYYLICHSFNRLSLMIPILQMRFREASLLTYGHTAEKRQFGYEWRCVWLRNSCSFYYEALLLPLIKSDSSTIWFESIQ